MMDRIERLADIQRIKNHGLNKRPTKDDEVFVVEAPKLAAPVIVIEADRVVFLWTADGTWRMYPNALIENFSKVDRGLGAVMALIAGSEGVDQEPVGHLAVLNHLKSWIYLTYKNAIGKMRKTGKVTRALSDLVREGRQNGQE